MKASVNHKNSRPSQPPAPKKTHPPPPAKIPPAPSKIPPPSVLHVPFSGNGAPAAKGPVKYTAVKPRTKKRREYEDVY